MQTTPGWRGWQSGGPLVGNTNPKPDMRKRCHRRPVAALPPRGLRAMLAPDQVRDLSISHHTHVGLVASGKGTPDLLWEMAGAALGWSRVAQKLGIGEAEMATELDNIYRVLERHRRTGRVGYSGPELTQAKAGLAVVDQLAIITDRATALEAMEWAEWQVLKLRWRAEAGPTAAAVSPPPPPSIQQGDTP